MRKPALIAAGAVVALVGAAVAAAAVFTAAGVSPTSATLTTGKATDTRTRTCTGADGKSFSVVDGKFTGTADFTNPTADLDGQLTMRTKMTLDTGSNLGIVEGSFRVKDGDTRVDGRITGTYDAANGSIAGLLTAHARGNHARVVGVLSGSYHADSGYALSLGSSPSGTLAVVAGPVCKPAAKPKPPKPAPKPKRFAVHGTLNSPVGTTPGQTVSVTAKGPTTATCTLDGSSPSTSGFNPGDKVEMKCENNGSTWILKELKKHK